MQMTKRVSGRHTFPHPAHFCFPFQDIDKFGNEITQLARPLPVEYLIIDVSVRHTPPPWAARCGLGAGGGGLDSCPSAWPGTGTPEVGASLSSCHP